jgi:hypothetical protein
MDLVLRLCTVVGPVAALTRAVGSTAAISAVLAERAATSTTTTEVSVAALDKVDLGIEDNHVAFLDAIADFHLRPQIPCHGYFPDVGVTTVETCKPLRLKMIVSAGTRRHGVSCGT